MNRLSSRGADFLKNAEGLRLKPYNDQTGEEITSWVPGATIGYGHLINSSDWDKYKNGVSKDEATNLFWRDLDAFEYVVNQKVKKQLYQQQFDALVIFVYNIGIGNFSRSSVLKLLNNPEAETDYTSLEDAWKAWNKSQGKVIQGLVNRREAEWKMYSEGI